MPLNLAEKHIKVRILENVQVIHVYVVFFTCYVCLLISTHLQ